MYNINCSFTRLIDAISGRVFHEKGHDTMEYFEEELEKYFENFKDLAESYPIWHGKHSDMDDPSGEKAVGHFKVSYKNLQLFFKSDVTSVLVRNFEGLKYKD